MPLEPVNMTEEEAVTLALSHFRRPKDPRPCEHADCPKMAADSDYCEEHHEHYYCECGQHLEDAYGQPGDGLCRRCD